MSIYFVVSVQINSFAIKWRGLINIELEPIMIIRRIKAFSWITLGVIAGYQNIIGGLGG